MIEPDVIHTTMTLVSMTFHDPQEHVRLVSSLSDFLIDTVSTAVDGPVLSSHNGLQGALILDVSRKTGNFGYEDNNLEPLTLFSGTDYTIGQGSADLVNDNLAFSGGGNTKDESVSTASVASNHARTRTGFLQNDIRNHSNGKMEKQYQYRYSVPHPQSSSSL